MIEYNLYLKYKNVRLNWKIDVRLKWNDYLFLLLILLISIITVRLGTTRCPDLMDKTNSSKNTLDEY